jgi:hypothetical protein
MISWVGSPGVIALASRQLSAGRHGIDDLRAVHGELADVVAYERLHERHQMEMRLQRRCMHNSILTLSYLGSIYHCSRVAFRFGRSGLLCGDSVFSPSSYKSCICTLLPLPYT